MDQANRVHSTPPTNAPVDTTRRHFLTVAAAGAASAIAAPALPAVSTIDPVFDLIEIHRKAEATHLAALAELNRLEKSGDHDSDWITEKPCHDEFEAFDTLLSAPATTLRGLEAKLAYLQDIAEQQAWMLNDRDDAAIRLLEGFAASVAALAGAQP